MHVIEVLVDFLITEVGVTGDDVGAGNFSTATVSFSFTEILGEEKVNP